MRRPEDALQKSLVAHLRAHLPPPWLVWATPNGGGRSKAEAGILKAMGVMAGIPDLYVLGPGEAPCRPFFVAIELKRPPAMLKSGKISRAALRLSNEQTAVIAALTQCGVRTIVARDAHTVVQALIAMGAPLRHTQIQFQQHDPEKAA